MDEHIDGHIDDHDEPYGDDIPALVPPHEVWPLVTQADLHRFWRMVRGPEGFDEPQLWLELIDAGARCHGLLTPIAALPRHPDETLLCHLLDALQQGLGQAAAGSSVAFLYARPGPPAMTAQDREWARALLAAAARVGLQARPVHLGHDQGVSVFAPDDVAHHPAA
jgi:hypothetical protein